MMKRKFQKTVLLIAIIFTFLMSNISPIFAAILKTDTTANLKILILHEGGEEASGGLTTEQEMIYDTNPYGYFVGDTRVYKIIEDGDYNYSDALYCLDGTMSFPGTTALEFTRVADMEDADNINVKGLNFSTSYTQDSATWISNYKSLMWLVDNLFLKKQAPEQKDEYLEKAFADYDTYPIDVVKAYLTDDDIDVVQQYAIWYFTNGDTAKYNVTTLPTIQLVKADNTTGTYSDIVGSTIRQDLSNYLYQYLITSAQNESQAEIEKVTYPSIVETEIKSQIDPDYGDCLIGPFKVNSGTATSGYDISLVDKNGTELAEYDYSIFVDGDFSDLTIDEIFDKEYYIYVYNYDVEEVYLKLTYSTSTTESSLWKQTTVVEGEDVYQPVILITRDNSNNEFTHGGALNRDESDLALRKYIVKVNDTEYNRAPTVDTSELSEGLLTTADYYHSKEPIEVNPGDTIVYEIRVYNEAEIAATGTTIIDILPTGLELAENSTINTTYNWTQIDEGENTVIYSSDYLSGISIDSYDGDDVLNSNYVQIECVVSDDVDSGTELTNVAEIEITDNWDRDSDTNNSSVSEDTTDYTGSDENKSDLSDSDYYYMGEEDDDDFEKVVIAEKIEIDVKKEWEDNDNEGGIRPDSIAVNLLADGEIKETVTLNDDNEWKYTFTDLLEYYAGNEIVYTVEEVHLPEGYTSVITGDKINGFTITNTYAPGKISIDVIKVWEDNGNQDGIRPQNIEVALYADGTQVKKATLNEANSWKVTFTNLLKEYNGVEIEYTINETAQIEGYEQTITGDKTSGFVITNTHEVEKTEIKVTKVWNDEENEDGIRPTSVEVILKANGEQQGEAVKLDESNSWTHTFEELDKNAEGKEITYTVEEINVPEGYTPIIAGDKTAGFTITNTHIPGKININVQKIWEDHNDQDGIRPASIEVDLYANGTQVKTATLNEANSWKVTFTNLDEKAEGELIDYTVSETAQIEGYEQTVTGDKTSGFVITNTHEVEKTEIKVTKVWDDNEDEDKIRPTSVEVILKANGIQVGNAVKLEESNSWTYTFTDLDKNTEGKLITYTVEEINVPNGYTPITTGDKVNGYIITNTHIPGKISISIQKIWEDNDNQDGIRPQSIEVALYADGTQVQTATLNEANSWKVTFTNLDEKTDGEIIDYTVKETSEIEGYETTIIGDKTTGFKITNTHEVEKTEIKVTKVWNDNENEDGIRPTSVEVILKANGEQLGEAVKLDESNSWIHTFEDLDKNAEGKEITYTVEEINVPEGYTPIIAGDKIAGFTITNTHIPGKINIPVIKVWEDNENSENIRPDKVTIVLYENEIEKDRIELNDENDWKHTFENLDKKLNGEIIVYTLEEVEVENRYTSNITGNSESGFIVTNTIIPEKINIPVEKIWNDNNNQDGLRPDKVTINLKANERIVDTVELNDENKWKHIFENLDKKLNGEIIVYTLEEVEVENGYTSNITGNSESGFIVTNTIIPEKINIPVEKVWSDGNNIDEIRPDKVTINLKANGTIVDTVELNDENEWEHTFSNLDKKLNGEIITYTIEEINVENGYTSNITGNVESGFIVTNTYSPRVREFDMSLQKFISKLNGKELEINREPVVDVEPLKQGKKDAEYKNVKTPLVVTKGDIVIYTIRVYNEGEISGYAEEISDYLPEGLGYLVNHKINDANKWSVPDDSKTVKLQSIIGNIYNLDVDDFKNVKSLDNIEIVQGKVKLTSNKLASNSKNNLIERFDIKNGTSLKYKDVEIVCVVLDDEVSNNNFKNLAEITKDSNENKEDITDRDSTPDTVNPDNYPGDDKDQDDNDYEDLITEKDTFDFSLQKFISKVNSQTISDREPKVSKDTNGKLVYTENAEPLKVENNDIITYTIRVYNEGNTAGYVSEISDDLPKGLEYLKDHEINKKYGWKLYDKNGKETTDLDKVTIVKTDYLSKEKSENRKEDNLIDAYNSAYAKPDYRDVQIAFKVVETEAKSLENRIIKNIAEITELEDPKGNEADDIDSTPGNNKDGEDDIDNEKVYVKYFDLSLRKDLVKIIITDNGKTREIGVSSTDGLQKVEVHRKRIDTTIVKFVYRITVTNEGEIAGYAKEIKDYVPSGLDFVASENPGWTEVSENVITTKALANTKLEPGASAYVDVTLKWINGENNFGMKVNTAEISDDFNESNTPDRDSIPNNKVPKEDDIDNAEVILGISTGIACKYIILSLTVLSIMVCGISLIKKYVLVK